MNPTILVGVMFCALWGRAVCTFVPQRIGRGPSSVDHASTVEHAAPLRFTQSGAGASPVVGLLSLLMSLLTQLLGVKAPQSSELQEAGTGFPPQLEQFINDAITNAEKKAVAQMMQDNRSRDLDQELLHIAEERLKKYWYIGQCRRDYTTTCPVDWTETEDGLCLPPVEYGGPCRASNFKDSSVLQKEDFAWKCQAAWPCRSAPSRDFSSACPTNWANIGGHLCIAPDNYAGNCSPAVDFANFSTERKAIWAKTCDAEWPVINVSKRAARRSLAAVPKNVGVEGPVSEEGVIHSVIKPISL
ncbi:cpw-wpc domain-containing protein [Toxoplasma gondii ME49]|uniref:Cpw-wpc domain-containing protein n=2 Tax=Toxoplasma gondii TaxID=5811 RepID=A0A125YQQ3_TOXGV|nr:cpw-wpc domain-containing protein [Toxoplasma gondii ME49]EPT25298.1 cpw-wpc domain-containing protein [Toxoplasma gondii ME49]ESS34630.1 cpw-wpc domain-containing protein [Toxoplasma gondii VEG]|eukprot:XP_018635119.1 cpw-wpc domain-containing protein [Toxoplasma gondii ME49]